MKRALALLAIALLPGAVVIAGIVAAYRYVTQREDKVSDATLVRIRKADEQDMRSRELDEMLVRAPRTVLDGPVSSYTKTA